MSTWTHLNVVHATTAISRDDIGFNTRRNLTSKIKNRTGWTKSFSVVSSSVLINLDIILIGFSFIEEIRR
ncbi:F-box/LRR-repeat protein 7 isoform X4 [Vespula maculifrons]|uniref:F-box/LRR-repeat protein 7 isoform X4 n=1 Tax=Vespula maculifrons TaxID=7453 RepID=A0ABD2BZJ8_VESMC